jgi:hypothetical protein
MLMIILHLEHLTLGIPYHLPLFQHVTYSPPRKQNQKNVVGIFILKTVFVALQIPYISKISKTPSIFPKKKKKKKTQHNTLVISIPTVIFLQNPSRLLHAPKKGTSTTGVNKKIKKPISFKALYR